MAQDTTQEDPSRARSEGEPPPAPGETISDEEFDRFYSPPPGIRGVFTAVNNQTIGRRYMVTAFIFFLIGGVQSLFMRAQLATSGNDVLSAQSYNELFTMHGTTMMFLFAIPFLEGLATYLLPAMLGSRDMPFPLYNAFNYWCYLLGGIILYSSFLVDMVPDVGWFAYVPLSGPEFADKSMDIWLFGLTLAELAAIGAAVEIAVSVLKTRAPGMSLDKMPIFAWTMLSVAVLIIVAFIPLIVASLLLEFDRTVGTAFFNQNAGGDPLLWQHLFWIFGHPEVYVMFLPGAAIMSHIIPIHSRHRLVAYPFVVVAIITMAIMSLGLWVHHMYTTGLPSLTLAFFTAASMTITLASGIQIFAWLATMWMGRPRFTVPMLFSLGFIVTFVAGGITGVMVASAAFDTQVHDTYFVVAHFHYVVIGGLLFPLFAGMYHWWPKFTGRMPNKVAGHVSFWLIFGGFHVTFFPMHLMGLWGLPRRVYTYDRSMGVDVVNLLSTVGAFVLAAGVLVYAGNLVHARMRGPQAPLDPWGGDTLEWATTKSPPYNANWPAIPVVTDRHPLWAPAGEPTPRQRDMAEAFDHRLARVRVSPFTSVLSAEPEGTMRLAAPSFWPLIPALGLAVIALGILLELYWISIVGVGVVIVGLIGWSRAAEGDNAEEKTEDVGGFAIEARGSRAVGWWAAWSTVAVLAVAQSTIALSTLFLQVNSGSWVQQTLNQPWLMAGVGLAIIVAMLANRWGANAYPEERTATGSRGTHLIAGGVSLVAGVIALVLLVVTWVRADLDPTLHAFNSAVMLLLAALGLAVLFAVGSNVAAVISRLSHNRDARPALMLQNGAIIWIGALFGWAITWVTTDVLPLVVI